MLLCPPFTEEWRKSPDGKRFAQGGWYPCSYRRASAYIEGPNPLTWDGIYHFLAEDCEVIDVPSGWTSIGPGGYKQLLLFFADAFPNSSVEVTNVFATEQEAVIEFVGRGANSGPLHLPTGDVPATGRSVELRFCDTIQIRKGKVVSVHIYYNVMTMLRQLGLAG